MSKLGISSLFSNEDLTTQYLKYDGKIIVYTDESTENVAGKLEVSQFIHINSNLDVFLFNEGKAYVTSTLDRYKDKINPFDEYFLIISLSDKAVSIKEELIETLENIFTFNLVTIIVQTNLDTGVPIRIISDMIDICKEIKYCSEGLVLPMIADKNNVPDPIIALITYLSSKSIPNSASNKPGSTLLDGVFNILVYRGNTLLGVKLDSSTKALSALSFLR